MKKTAGRTAWQMKIKILTPVFVGGGADSILNRTGYIYDAQKRMVYVLDESKWIRFLIARGCLDEYARYVAENGSDGAKGSERPSENRQRGNRASPSSFKRNPNANKLHLFDWLTRKNVTRFDDFARYAVPALEVEKSILNDLLCFARDGLGRPYIPGSSIKGALRTIILKDMLSRQREQEREPEPAWQRFQQKVEDLKKSSETKDKQAEKHSLRELKAMGPHLEEKYFNRIEFAPAIQSDTRKRPQDSSPLRDVFRGISISDSRPIDPGSLYITRRVNISAYNKNGHRKALPVYAEYLKPGTEVAFTMTLDESYLGPTAIKGVEDVMKILESYSLRLPWMLGDEHFSSLGDYRWSAFPDITPNLCLGGGGGFPVKTVLPELAGSEEALLKPSRVFLNHKFSRHKHIVLDQKRSPRTIKLASFQDDDYVVGMCRMEACES